VSVFIILIFTVVIAYYFIRKKDRVKFVTETRVDGDIFQKYNSLMKEATALKKAGEIGDAIEKIKEAYKEAQEKKLTLTIKDYLKLPTYLQKDRKNDEAWGWFNNLISAFARDPMSLSQIYKAMGLFRERENNRRDAIKFSVLSDIYWCLGLHEQVTQLGCTDRRPELTQCKRNIADGYRDALKKAGCEHLEEKLKKTINEHMKEFPNLHISDLVRDVDRLMSE